MSSIAETLSPTELAAFQEGLVGIDALTLSVEQKDLVRGLLSTGTKASATEVRRIWQVAEERVRSTPGLQAQTKWLEQGNMEATTEFNYALRQDAKSLQHGAGAIEVMEVAEIAMKIGTHVGFQAVREKSAVGATSDQSSFLIVYKDIPYVFPRYKARANARQCATTHPRHYIWRLP
jgi:hypothetical protein